MVKRVASFEPRVKHGVFLIQKSGQSPRNQGKLSAYHIPYHLCRIIAASPRHYRLYPAIVHCHFGVDAGGGLKLVHGDFFVD